MEYNGDSISETEWFHAEMEDAENDVDDSLRCPNCGDEFGGTICFSCGF